MTEAKLLRKQYEDGIHVITFNCPRALNALDVDTMQRFSDAVDALEHDESLRVLILRGAGERAFCSGGDLNDLADRDTEDKARHFSMIMGDALLRMERLPVPVIAAVNGYALGGGAEIALACDMRIVDEKARLGMVHMRMGVTPAWGAGQRLMRLVGYSRAMHILLRSHVMHAQELKELQLALNVVEQGQAFEFAIAYARHIVQCPPETVRGVKALLQAGWYNSYEDALMIERDIFPPLWAGDAHAEAVAQFLEHQKEYEAAKRAKQNNNTE